MAMENKDQNKNQGLRKIEWQGTKSEVWKKEPGFKKERSKVR